MSISVVITTYNRLEYLEQAITSVLNQDISIDEIIVIDDCSTVCLQEIKKKYQHKVAFYSNQVNRGVSYSRNRGVEVATSKYIAFLDDDDVLLSYSIRARLIVMERSDLQACLCNYKVLETGFKEKNIHSGYVTIEQLKLGNQFCGISGLMARRDSLKLHKFDENLSMGEDWDVFLNLCNLGNVYYISYPLFLYRKENQQSLTRKTSGITLQDLINRTSSVEKNANIIGLRNYHVNCVFHLMHKFANQNNKYITIKYIIVNHGVAALYEVIKQKCKRKWFTLKEHISAF